MGMTAIVVELPRASTQPGGLDRLEDSVVAAGHRDVAAHVLGQAARSAGDDGPRRVPAAGRGDPAARWCRSVSGPAARDLADEARTALAFFGRVRWCAVSTWSGSRRYSRPA